jgi:hypothetical protein
MGAVSAVKAVRALAMLPALACLVGCEEPTPLPPITWSGDHLDYGEIGEVPHLCGGTLPYMDDFVGIIHDRAQADLDERVLFYLSPEGWDSEWCAGGGYGCSRGTVAFGRGVPLEHELVHAALDGAVGDGDRVLGEGIAEAWGSFLSTAPPFEGDISEMLRDSSGRLETRFYGRAGHFVSFLLGEFGTAAIMEVMAMTKPDATEQQLDSAFLSVFGTDIDGIVSAYAEYPECHSKAYSEPVWACTTLPSLGTIDRSRELEVRFRVTLDCSDDVTIGSDASGLSIAAEQPDEMWQWVAFDVVETSGCFYQQAEAPVPSRIELMRCDIGCPSAYEEISVPAVSIAEGKWLDLEPGHYVARVARRVDSPGWVSALCF